MGTAGAPDQINFARKQIPIAVQNSLYTVLAKLGFPKNQWPDTRKLNELWACLCSFKHNEIYWYSTNMEDAQLLLKHLAFTLFVPGGKAERARRAVNLLIEQGLLSNPECDVATISTLIRPYVRFHNVKANRILHALDIYSEMRAAIITARYFNPPAESLRIINIWLRTNIQGLGAKATAHYMRNTGLWDTTFAFPIIDVHIHKALEALCYSHHSYTEAETSFCKFSAETNIPVILLDAVLWCSYANNWNFNNSDFDNYTNKNKGKSNETTRI